MSMDGFMCIDMESLKYKEATIEMYKRLRKKYSDNPHLGIVFQAYLKCVDEDVQDLLDWSRAENLPISIRLVKGAYWGMIGKFRFGLTNQSPIWPLSVFPS